MNAARGSELNLSKYILKASSEWAKNINVFEQVIQRGNIDLVIGDETYEILIAMFRKKLRLNIPFVIIYDFLGLDAMTRNPMELLTVYMTNKMWAQDQTIITRGKNMALFVGEPEDVQDKKFGIFLPNRRTQANKYYQFIGYILPFSMSRVLLLLDFDHRQTIQFFRAREYAFRIQGAAISSDHKKQNPISNERCQHGNPL